MVISTLAPVSTAQGGEPFFTIRASATPAQEISERFGETIVFLNVSVVAQNANPLTDQFTIEVTINRTAPNPVPNGWAIGTVEPASFQLAPGETRQVQVPVSLQIEDPDAEKISLSFVVRSRPSFEGVPTPLTQAFIAAASQEDTTQVNSQVTRSLEPAEALTSFVFQYKWILIAAVVAIIIVMGLLLRGRTKAGIVVSTDQGVQEVVPGRGASFPLTVTNLGAQREAIVLGTSEVPNGWNAILPVDRLELRANETTTIWLTLKSPVNAKPGERIQVGFIATTSDGSGYETLLEASVVEKYGEAPPPAQEEESAASEGNPGRARARAR